MFPVFSLDTLGCLVLFVVLTQAIIALVTVYFHRVVSHRAVALSPAAHRSARFLSWFLIAMVPREFAAVHRKHHARCDLPDDPHSPVHYGWKRVLFGGLGLYRQEAGRPETLEKYGQGMQPDPWEGFYLRHRNLGILLFAGSMGVLFGWQGLLVWATCMAWIPFWAAGVINGLGHHVGYRNFATDDASTNLVPWGVWVGGEELHNNHHADPSAAKFSMRWYEVDLGWGWICLLRWLGLATVRTPARPATGMALLLQRRYQWLAEFQASLSTDLADALARQGFSRWQHLSGLLDRAGAQRAGHAASALDCPRLASARQLEQGLRDLWRVRRVEAAHARAAFEAWLLEARILGGEQLRAFCDRLQPPAHPAQA